MDEGEDEIGFRAAAAAPSSSNDLVERVYAYGEAHSGVVVNVRVDQGPPARLVVMLWGDDVAVHQEALLKLTGEGEVLEFETARWSLAQLEDIRTEITAMTDRSPGAVKGSGPSDGVMGVQLRADQESLAADLHQRYGEAVSLSVGLFPYPLGRDLTRIERLRRPDRERHRPPAKRISIPGVSARLDLVTPVLRPGEDGRGRIVVANDGPNPVELHTDQPLTAWVADTSSGELVGGFTGFVAGTGWQLSLKSG